VSFHRGLYREGTSMGDEAPFREGGCQPSPQALTLFPCGAAPGRSRRSPSDRAGSSCTWTSVAHRPLNHIPQKCLKDQTVPQGLRRRGYPSSFPLPHDLNTRLPKGGQGPPELPGMRQGRGAAVSRVRSNVVITSLS